MQGAAELRFRMGPLTSPSSVLHLKGRHGTVTVGLLPGSGERQPIGPCIVSEPCRSSDQNSTLGG